MILCKCNLYKFNQKYSKCRKVLFGLSKGLLPDGLYIERGISMDNIEYLVDNDADKQGAKNKIGKDECYVYAPSRLCKEKDEIIVLITTLSIRTTYQIIKQIVNMGLADNFMVFSARMIIDQNEYDNSEFINYFRYGQQKIKKLIHCFWAGGEKPQNIVECIDSWKKFCPDYEIIEWNENNYDLAINEYVKQASKEKKWAFVSDYVRLDVIYKYGGIYLDFDVEMRRPLDDLLCFDAFMAFEPAGFINIGSGMGAIGGNSLIKRLLDQYKDIPFLKEGESYSSRTVVMQPIRQMDAFGDFGYEYNGRSQIIDNIAFLSPDIINTIDDPKHHRSYLRGNEYLVHWTHASWYDDEHRRQREESMDYRDKLYGMNWINV